LTARFRLPQQRDVTLPSTRRPIMRAKLSATALALVVSFVGADGVRADDGAAPTAGKPAPRADAKAAAGGGIQWFATWEQGAAEAKRTGRPILLVAAAPHCHDISGLW
jgi:hypothetical protein